MDHRAYRRDRGRLRDEHDFGGWRAIEREGAPRTREVDDVADLAFEKPRGAPAIGHPVEADFEWRPILGARGDRVRPRPGLVIQCDRERNELAGNEADRGAIDGRKKQRTGVGRVIENPLDDRSAHRAGRCWWAIWLISHGHSTLTRVSRLLRKKRKSRAPCSLPLFQADASRARA